MTLQDLHIDKSWTLFLDRDGVINRRFEDDYIKKWEEFEFLPGVLDSIRIFTERFGKIFVVTNQQGIGKGIMTERDLENIHNRMQEEVRYEGGRIMKIYHSPYREEEKSVFRKPKAGMARKAKIDFPDIDFQRSLMIGDSITDMQFGRNAGMITLFITRESDEMKDSGHLIDMVFPDLKSVADQLVENG
ncbi:MAG: HAD-IIIA family hydrolase [Bacteroidales bacterium]|nr:HAD-IIIA family hydrolase [Bacteroidales bacterium]